MTKTMVSGEKSRFRANRRFGQIGCGNENGLGLDHWIMPLGLGLGSLDWA